MSSAARLIAELHAAGASLRAEGNDPVLGASAGLITAEIRDELVRHKLASIALLPSGSDNGQNLDGTRHEIAVLLAAAYRRLKAARHIGHDHVEHADVRRLAKQNGRSVHGVVE